MPAAHTTNPSTSTWTPEKSDRAPIAIELCSGLGAIGVGLRSLGFRVAHAYDSWDAAVAIYNHNAPEPVAAKCDLIAPDSVRRIRAECGKLAGIELLAAGPPCKGFSQIRNGNHDKEIAYKQNQVLAVMPEYVAALRPRFVLIENVPDLTRHRAGKTLHELITGLAAPGPRRLRYRVEYQVYDAALSGTPQARRRILILGVRSGCGAESLPDPGPDLAPLFAAIRHGREIPGSLRRYQAALQDGDDLALTSATQALSDIPLLEAGAPEAPLSYANKPQTAFQRLMREGAPAQLSNTQTPSARTDTIHRLALIRPGGCARDIPAHQLNGLSRRFDSAYRRLHPDAPSTALSTRYDCVYHYACDRSLSVREYARLQGLPDVLTFPEALACRRSAYEMIGNSVPPLLIKAVLGEALRRGEA
jgi:DNA (cytosine-5)-methyltransferase 1